MRIIGDVHGKIKQYLSLLEGVDSSLQLGDMGIGFSGVSLPEMEKHIVITHDCPEVIGEMLLNRYALGGFGGVTKFPTRTGKALQSMWMEWKPELWIFGHYHAHFDKTVLGTRFVCLNELAYMDM